MGTIIEKTDRIAFFKCRSLTIKISTVNNLFYRFIKRKIMDVELIILNENMCVWLNMNRNKFSNG